jgi:Glycosyltransferase sugar-binding region containing DXD motif
VTRLATGDGLPLVQYWHSEAIPDYIRDLMATFRQANPGAQHLIFDEQTAAELIAERFGDRQLRAFRSCAVPAMQADYFRYCAIYALGGVYVDADLACRHSLDGLHHYEGQLFEHPNGPMVNGFFAFRSIGHPLLAMTIEIATRNIENRWTNNVGFVTGPLIFTGLNRLRQTGSIEKMRDAMGLGKEWQPALDATEAAVAAHGPLERAFDGVRISSRGAMSHWIRTPDRADLHYKNEDDYWFNWQGSIYRTGSEARSKGPSSQLP